MKSRSVWHGSQMYPWPWTCSGTWRGGRQRSKATRSPSQYSTHQARSTWPTPPRAGGCGGSHHPLERSATDGSVEARTSPGCGLHRGLEAGRADTKKIKVGPGLDSTTQLGPLVSDEQQRRVLSYLDSGFSEDAKAVVRGRILGGKGYFVEPTVLVEVLPMANDSIYRIATELRAARCGSHCCKMFGATPLMSVDS